MHFLFTRWSNINDVLDKHKDKLATALDIHAFNRDVDDLNERINEKVGNIVVV
jgi:spectrin beta